MDRNRQLIVAAATAAVLAIGGTVVAVVTDDTPTLRDATDAALGAERASADERIAGLEQDVLDRDVRIEELLAEIEELRSQVPPSPSPTPTAVPSPSATVAPPSSSPTPSPGPFPEPPASETRGKQLRFSILCPTVKSGGEVRRERIDPLVAPGRPSSHFHTFFGAKFVTPLRDVELARSQGSTCEFSGDTGAYWIPVLYDRSGQPIDPVQVLVYYRHDASRGRVVAHPQDHGIIATDYSWMCEDSDNFRTPPDCRDKFRHPNGAGLRIVFDSERIDGGSTPRVAFNIRYGQLNLTGANLGRNTDGTLVAEHGDFWNTWHQPSYETLVNRCLNQNGVWRSYTTTQWERRCAKVTDADFAIGD